MESPSCNGCGTSETVLLFTCADRIFPRPQRFGIVRCKACGLVFLSPRPEKGEMGGYYPPEYQEEIQRLIEHLRGHKLLQQGLRMLRQRRTPPIDPPGSLLDVGCSHGDYLCYLRDLGWEVEGIEQDPDAALRAREEHRLPVHVGDAEQVLRGLPPDRFHVVTLWHLLEHLYDPMGCLKEIHRILKPGGLLMLELPDFNSLPARWFGPHWYPLEVPRHLYHFTPTTLTRMLSRAGFEVQEIRSIPAPEALVWSLRLLKDYRRGPPGGGKPERFLALNPWVGAMVFPFCWFLARLGRADHMAVRARRKEQPT